MKRVREESERGVGSGAQPFEVRITPFRMSKGIIPHYFAVVPVFMTDANESF